jgi:catechol 2,3-dioxygenase-like lactoylglutathione lyase family enzyme
MLLNRSRLMAFAATAKPEEARRFYREVLGLSLVEEGPFALVFDACGTMLRVQKVEAHAPQPHTTLGWQVDDIRGTMRSLEQRGVRFERYAGLPQDEAGVWTTPDGASVAWFKDPDGNVLSLTQF